MAARSQMLPLRMPLMKSWAVWPESMPTKLAGVKLPVK